MRRLAGIWMSAFVLVAAMVAGAPSATAYASHTAAPANVSAGYMLHEDFGGHGWTRRLMTLQENHTGYTDLDTIVWSRQGRQITLVLTSRQDPSLQTTYIGTLMPGSISRRRVPGTVSGSDGRAGVFYALDKTT